MGVLALKVRSDAAFRATAGAPSWAEFLEDEAATWTLPEAVKIAVLLADAGPATAAPNSGG